MSAYIVAGGFGPPAGGPTLINAQSVNRQDVRDLALLLDLATKLHPELSNEGLSIRADLGYVDGRLPYTVEVRFVAPAVGADRAERVSYAGWAQFDVGGALRVYGANHTVGRRRLDAVRGALAGAAQSEADVRRALRAAGAKYVDDPPDLRRLHSSRTVIDAMGLVKSVSVPVFDPSPDTFEALAGSHWTPELVWRATAIVEQSAGVRRLSLAVDPWGDVVSVNPLPD